MINRTEFEGIEKSDTEPFFIIDFDNGLYFFNYEQYRKVCAFIDLLDKGEIL